MSTEVYGFPSPATGANLPSADLRALGSGAETALLGLAELVGPGFAAATDGNATLIGGSIALAMSPVTFAVVGDSGQRKVVTVPAVTITETSSDLTPSATNYIFLLRAPTDAEDDATWYTSNTTGTPPADSILAVTGVADGTEFTSRDNLPQGRVNLQSVGRMIGLAADRPTTAPEKFQYFATDTNGGTLYYYSGGWVVQGAAGNAYVPGGTDVAVADGGTGASSAATARSNLGLADATLLVVFDGGGAPIAVGAQVDVEVPYACTITRVTMLADQSGSIQVDVWKDTYANFPPTNADSITASAEPEISGATKGQDSTLTGWTTALSAGDILRFNVDSVTDIERLTLSLKVTR